MQLTKPSTPPSITSPSLTKITVTVEPMLTIDELRDALQPIFGYRPSRELIMSWREKDLPVFELGARTVKYALQDVWDWMQTQKVVRSSRRETRMAGQRIVSDPRLRLKP
jgi:hypothetical protein